MKNFLSAGDGMKSFGANPLKRVTLVKTLARKKVTILSGVSLIEPKLAGNIVVATFVRGFDIGSSRLKIS